ncbi:MAG TPA: hypothetical protein VHE61_15270 [Opitutaceae bacterium]|nr:hypothetical protein [Opitutaceae bacterium]
MDRTIRKNKSRKSAAASGSSSGNSIWSPPADDRFSMLRVFENHELMPDEWKDAAGVVRTFNPGLVRDGTGWLLAFRIVSEPGLRRRIAMCRLDDKLRVVAGSVVPWSDWIHFPRPQDFAPEASVWFADPRLYRLAGRQFVHWNSGWHEPQNHQFLQEIDDRTLRPIGPPREFRLRGQRQKLEKNWTFFERDGLHAVYSINPHRILTFAVSGAGPIVFADFGQVVPNPDGFAQVHGGLRGGAPPQILGRHFYSFCHSVENGNDGYRYVPSVYRFSAMKPFAPTDMPVRSLSIELPGSSRRAMPKLNPAVSDVLYPAGAARDGDQWLLSFGIDDERCAIARLSNHDVEQTLAPVTRA